MTGKKMKSVSGAESPAGKNVVTDRTYIITDVAPEVKLDKRRVIGHAICPDCNQKIQVANDNGLTGSALYDYALDHTYQSSIKSCIGSNRRPMRFDLQKKTK